MNALMRCLFRVCCDAGGDDDDDTNTSNGADARNAIGPARMTRQVTPSTGHDTTHYQVVGTEMDVVSADGGVASGENACCQPSAGENNQGNCIHGFIRRLQESLRKYDGLETVEGFSTLSETASLHARPGHQENCGTCASPLRTALKFDLTRVVPTIRSQEVVLPGSILQKEMSQAISMKVPQPGDECVICMEGFDETNPRMPTLCGCGENKTFFHLPCLYQWIEQSRTCPTCRQTLRWEEF